MLSREAGESDLWRFDQPDHVKKRPRVRAETFKEKVMKKLIPIAICAAVALSAAAVSYAQSPKAMNERSLEAYSKDVESLDSIISALYDSISGGAGVKRDWKRFNNLFVEGARLIPTVKDGPDGLYRADMYSPDGYVKRSEAYLVKNGFFEREIARKQVRFGNIAHVFSTYEGRNKEEDEKPFLRGINSIQLLFDKDRWWVVTVYWQAETPDNHLPEEFLPGN